MNASKKKNIDYDEENAADIEDADERGDEDIESQETTQRASDKKLNGIYKEDIHESSKAALKSVD